MITSLAVSQTVSITISTSGEHQQWPEMYRPGDIIPAIIKVHKHKQFATMSLHGSLVGKPLYIELASVSAVCCRFYTKIIHSGEVRTWAHPPGGSDLYQTMVHTHLNQHTSLANALTSIEGINIGAETAIPTAFILPEHYSSNIGQKATMSYIDGNDNDTMLTAKPLPLPPSCSAGAVWVDPWGQTFMQPLIIYYLQISLRFRLPGQGATRTITVKHEISVTASPCSDPPMYSRNAVEIEPARAWADIRRSRFTKPFARLLIEMAEPMPVVSCSTASGGQTTGLLRLIWATTTKAYDEFETGKKAAKVEYEMRARTRYCATSTFLDDDQPAGGDLKPNQFMVSSFLNALEARAADLDDVVLPVGESKTRSLSGTIPLPVRLNDATIPTFSHALASRDYALIVKVKIRGLQHDALRLEVPVQVCEVTVGDKNGDTGSNDRRSNDLAAEVSCTK